MASAYSNLTAPSNSNSRPASPAVDALEEFRTADTPTNDQFSHGQSPALTSNITDAVTADLTLNVHRVEPNCSQNGAIRTSTPVSKSKKNDIQGNPADRNQTNSLHSNNPMSPDQSTIGENSVIDLKSGNASCSLSQSDSPQSFHSLTPDRQIEGGELLASHSSGTQTDDASLHEMLKVPILGYEVMEERSRFTVFKVQVRKSEFESWFIFRRYTDFVRLNDKLKELFPHFRLALPPKRWFGDNFDRTFLDDRLLGLQAFLNNVAGHKDIVHSNPMKRFFCLDDQPGPHDSLEESRAFCECLEEGNYILQKEVEDRDTRISLLQEELSIQRNEIDNLKKALKRARTERRRGSQQSELSVNDTSALAEADQQRYVNTDGSETPVTRRSPAKERLYADHRLSLSNMSVGSMDVVLEEDKQSIASLPNETAQQNADQHLKCTDQSSKNSASGIENGNRNRVDSHRHSSNSDSKSTTSSQSGDSIMILDHEVENRNTKQSGESLAQGESVRNQSVNGKCVKEKQITNNEHVAKDLPQELAS